MPPGSPRVTADETTAFSARTSSTRPRTPDRSGLGMRAPSFIVGRYLEIEVDLRFERTVEPNDPTGI